MSGCNKTKFIKWIETIMPLEENEHISIMLILMK